MSDWFSITRQKHIHVLEAIKKQPFITQLIDGSLPQDVFKFYIHQDSIYLAEYKKTLAILATRCRDSEDIQFFLDAATGIINVEDALHQIFLKDYDCSQEPSPTCELYTSYLAKSVCNGSLEEGLAAVLPCFSIYQEVGDYILEQQQHVDNNPFQDWINTYGGDEFANSVRQAIAITNKYAQQASAEVLQKMDEAFLKASKLEWMFWDSAFNKEQWKI